MQSYSKSNLLSLASDAHNGTGSAFFQITNTSSLNQQWQLYPTPNNTYILRSGQSTSFGYLTARSISDRVAGFFAENETAMVIKKFREMDPGFQMEPFVREMREYILPEVLDAYVKGDTETLKLWLSAAQFQVYDALSSFRHESNGVATDEPTGVDQIPA